MKALFAELLYHFHFRKGKIHDAAFLPESDVSFLY
jgi:hypothetical protein